MVGQRCFVKNCGNTSRNCSKEVSFHTFPVGGSVRQKWIDFCGLGDWSPKKGATICSQHFGGDDFHNFSVTCSQNSRRRLFKNAVPSMNPKTVKTNDWLTETLQEDLPLREITNENNQDLLDNENNQDLLDNETEIQQLKKELERQKEAYEANIVVLKKSNASLAEKLQVERTTNNNLEKTMSNLKKQYSKAVPLADLNNKIKELLAGSLSSSQLDKILNIKRKIKWSKTDIAKAFTLRYFSRRAYTFMQNENYPLPNLRTLQRYAQLINLRSGILHDVLNFMKVTGETMPQDKRATVLLFDEMSVRGLYEYNKADDEIMGPHKYLQVIIARGLFGNWKQPIYVAFDTNMTKDILFEAIIALHRIQFDVVAVVGDCGSSNQGTLSQCGVTLENVCFEHPCTEENVYCFPDAPHLLKLIRNWFLRTGFVTPNGDFITKKPVQDLIYKAENAELSSLHKLTERHLLCLGSFSDKQNVALAAQLLSHTTAVALKRYSANQDAKSVSEFIQLVNDWFDIMNSRNLKEPTYFKKPYEATENQIEKLDEMYKFIYNIRCNGKDNLQIFQKSILISITSLKLLFEDMKKKFNIKFILTAKLNQDALESMFGHLRCSGGLDDHPTPLNVLYRLRMIILGKSPGVVQEKTNILNYQEDEHYVMSTFFKDSGVTPMFVEPDTIESDEPSEFSSSPSTSSSISLSQQVEEDGLVYLSGWLARKFNKSFPHLGSYTYMIKREEHNYSQPSWVQQLSYGGLTEPSTTFKKNIDILEKCYKRINKNRLKIKKKVVQTLFRLTKDKVDLPEEVTKAFLKQRTLIRIKKLNQQRLLEPKNKGKTKTNQKFKKLIK